MNDHAGGAAEHRVCDKSMAVMPLALQGDENRTSFDLHRIGHNFTESPYPAISRHLAAGRCDNFCFAPRHSPSAYSLARRANSSRATSRSSKCIFVVPKI